MMFFAHGTTAWLDPQYKGGLYSQGIDWLAGLVAPVFMVLAGLSAVLAARRPGSSWIVMARRLFRRGLQIAFLGVGLSFLFHALRGFSGPVEKLWRADILLCIGLSMALLPWIAWPLGGRFRKWLPLGAFVALPLAALGLAWLGIEEILLSPFSAQLSVRAGNGAFPLVPYGAWMALGFFLGAVFPMSQDGPAGENRFFVGLLLAAGLFYVASEVAAWAFFRFDIFAPGGTRPGRGMLHGFLHKGSLVFVLMIAARLSMTLFPVRGPKLLILLGRTSLFAYCAHLLFLYHLGGQILAGSLSPFFVFLSSLALSALMFGLCFVWDRRHEWAALQRLRIKALNVRSTKSGLESERA
jgi:hypothetical protein